MPFRTALATTSWRVTSSPENPDGWRPTAHRPHSRPPAPDEDSIPLQRSLLPHVDEPDQEDEHEHQHLHQAERGQMTCRAYAVRERDITRKLAEARAPRD